MKDIIKVIRSLENKGIFLKGAASKISNQEGGFLRFLKPLMSVGLSLINSLLTSLAKSVLVLLGLTAAASATDATIQKKSFGSGHPLDLASWTATLAFSNEDLNYVMEIVKSLEESVLLMKSVNETIENEA